jgi:hypothetical protein
LHGSLNLSGRGILCVLCEFSAPSAVRNFKKLLTADFAEDPQEIAEKMSPKNEILFSRNRKRGSGRLENSSIPNLMSPVLSGSRVGTWRPG